MMNPPRRVVGRSGTRPAVRPVVRPANRPGSRPSGAPGPARRDPIDAIVDGIIAGRVSPLIDERRQVQQQSAGNELQQQRLGSTYDQKLAGLQDSARLDLGSAVAQAAKLRGYSDDDIREYQEWSRGLLAETGGGTGAQQVAESGQQVIGANRAAFDSMGAEIASRGENTNDWLTKQRAAGSALTNELIGQERLRRAAAERDIAGRISAERAQRGQLKYDIGKAEREFEMQKLAADRAFGMQQAQLALDAAGGSSGGGSESGSGGGDSGGIYGFGKDRDDSIQRVMAMWRQGLEPQVNKDGEPVLGSNGKPLGPSIKQPWRKLFEMLRDMSGLTADQAALLATRTRPSSIKNAPNGHQGVITMLRNRGVSEGVQRWILRTYFGQRAVNQYFGSKYSQGGNVLAPGNLRNPDSKPAADRPVTTGMIRAVIRRSPYPVRRGTELTINDKNYNVQSVQRTVGGMTYTIRDRNGREFVVTV